MNKWMRAGALLLVVCILALVLMTLYFAITGSPYFTASFVAMLMLPLLLYAYMFIYRIFKKGE